MSAVETIWAALEADSIEHRYECEHERWFSELGDRPAEELAMNTDPVIHHLAIALRIRNTVSYRKGDTV